MDSFLKLAYVADQECFVVPWQRMAPGLWGMTKGDIYAAYSAHSLPKVRTFAHRGRLFTCMQLCCLNYQPLVNCYPLHPVGDAASIEPGYYSGRIVAARGSSYCLGREVMFTGLEPTVEEWREILRAQYAHCTMYSDDYPYAQFVRLDCVGRDGNVADARRLDLHDVAAGILPETKTGMLRLLQREGQFSAAQFAQCEFSL